MRGQKRSLEDCRTMSRGLQDKIFEAARDNRLRAAVYWLAKQGLRVEEAEKSWQRPRDGGGGVEMKFSMRLGKDDDLR